MCCSCSTKNFACNCPPLKNPLAISDAIYLQVTSAMQSSSSEYIIQQSQLSSYPPPPPPPKKKAFNNQTTDLQEFSVSTYV